ncbi:micrococcal nuclease [Mesobacillus persicus]|uniref:Micrococcal nuclease n=1 Tax=Mesobacillus persicus TaxID=930146 RepID=A0A1H8D532_9BACI|nr:thermonuclease family protein [Mesobacillus persicus]SEN02329.1 micrococcal nuclease [Mesobacillus persicus]
MSTKSALLTHPNDPPEITPDHLEYSAQSRNQDKDQPVVQSPTEFSSFQAAIVQRAIDGDTIELTNRQRVRLIGINTPESTYKNEVYGKEARNYTQEQLAGRTVWLQKDLSERDRYGRLLRIVWVEQPDNYSENEIRLKMFNAELILKGYAEPSTFPPDVKFSPYFRQFAREARGQKVGLWRFGGKGTTTGDFDFIT